MLVLLDVGARLLINVLVVCLWDVLMMERKRLVGKEGGRVLL
jgi:hypothetical protein